MNNKRKYILLFLAPAFCIYTLFMVYPLVESIRLSFFKTVNNGDLIFVGWANFEKMLTDPLWYNQFLNGLKNNFYFFFIHMIIQNPLGLLFASLISMRFLRASNFYRTMLFLPTLLSFVLVGFIWKLIISPLWGITENFLIFFGLGDWFQPWLGLPETALVTVALISVWQFIGIPMMLFYAALINIPDEIIDAGYCDGLSGWSIFWKIKIPLLFPTIGIISILTFVGNFNAFDLIYVMQGAIAGPAFSTDILGTFFYRTFFGFQLQPGDPNLGAVLASMMFFIILTGVCIYLFLIQTRFKRYQL